MAIDRTELLIGGRWQASTSGELVDVVSPIAEEIVGRVPRATEQDVDKAVNAARAAFDSGPWPRMSLAERAAILCRAAELVEPHLAEILDVEISEIGSPYRFAASHTLSFQWQVDDWIAIAEKLPEREVRTSAQGKYMLFREPVGVVGAIVPWNAPFGILASKLIPALLSGCTFVAKPAAESPISALMLADALEAAGFPEGVVSILPGGAEVGRALVNHPGVDKISFTGSGTVGREIGSTCGSNIKPVTLELGGKSAAIILDDADLDRDLESLLANSLPNNGQVCYATTRLLAPWSRYDEVVDKVVARVSEMTVGDPHEQSVDFGPLVSARQRDRVESYIQAGLEEGARVAFGGGRPDIENGFYVQPTVFADVKNSMKIAQEEIFGPVLTIIGYEDDDEAVAIANDSKYGLGGAVFTQDLERGLDVAGRIRTGTLAVNDGAPAGGGGPFGGYKESGVGRELSAEGIGTYQQLKSVGLPANYEAAV